MYYANQIIWDIDKKKLVELSNPGDVFAWDASQYPKNHTHLIYSKEPGKIYCCEGGMAGAEYLMERGEILPARLEPKAKQPT